VKSAEVHNLKDDELVAKLIDAKEEAFNLRFGKPPASSRTPPGWARPNATSRG